MKESEKMKIRKFIALLCACVFVLSAFSSCSKDKDVDGDVTETTTKTETTKPEKRVKVKTNDGDPLNMRAGAGTSNAVVAQIPNGTELVIIDEQYGWGYTSYGEITGWIKLDYTQEETTIATIGKEETTVAEKTEATTKSSGSYAYSYAGFNPKVISVTDYNWKTVLVNRNYILKEGYKPQLAEAVKGSGQYLDYRVAPYYQKMYDAALKDGVTLSPCSGYRSYDLQKNNFENKISYYMNQGYDKITATQNAARVILPPGTSEHNAGLAMDIGWVTEDFENSSAFAWLTANAQDYGFIMRYPKSEEKQQITEIIYEPWHWRFVGVELAQELKASGQVLEEYLGR